MKRIYFGHHKCGSTWLQGLLKRAFGRLGQEMGVFWLGDTLPLNWHFRQPWYNRIAQQRHDFLDQNMSAVAHINAYPSLLSDLNETPYKAIHVIRDPRDILISGYFSHFFSHQLSPDINPWKITYREKLEKIASKEKALLHELSYSDHYLRRIDTMWQLTTASPNILTLHMEDITANPKREFQRIFQHLDIWSDIDHTQRIDPSFLNILIDEFSFENLKKNNPEHYREGETKGWQHHFTPELTSFFSKLHPGLIKRLGYEE